MDQRAAPSSAPKPSAVPRPPAAAPLAPPGQGGQSGEPTPAGDAPLTDVLAELDVVEERPLSEQVAVFEAVHEDLSARLASAED